MKINFVLAACIGFLLFSCAPKLIVQAAEPAVSTTPEVTATVQSSMVSTAASPEAIAQGKELFDNTCSKCHKLFPATMHSREEWVPILARMQNHGNISEMDMAGITTYIHSELP